MTTWEQLKARGFVFHAPENIEDFKKILLPDLDTRPLPYFTKGDIIYLKLMGVSL